MRIAETLIRLGGADAQSDLNLYWAHMSFCWFCREAAHLLFIATDSSVPTRNECLTKQHCPISNFDFQNKKQSFFNPLSAMKERGWWP